jgi:alpha-ketoglutaric semialdehyde dehydrogenase
VAKKFQNFVAGEWRDAASGGTFENRNPADGSDLVGTFPRSTADDLARAVASAKRGFELWRRTPAPLRGDVLRRVGDLLSERKEASTRRITPPWRAAACSAAPCPASCATSGQ